MKIQMTRAAAVILLIAVRGHKLVVAGDQRMRAVHRALSSGSSLATEGPQIKAPPLELSGGGGAREGGTV